jgi:hypothetical protein
VRILKNKNYRLIIICVGLLCIFGVAFSNGDMIGELEIPSHSVLPNPPAGNIPSSPLGSPLPVHIQKVSGVSLINAKDFHNRNPDDNPSLSVNSSAIERRPFVITDEMLAEWKLAAKKSNIQPDVTITDSGTTSKSLLSYMPWSSYSTRDQGQAGNCWVWASTAVAEIDHTIDTGIRDILSIGWLVRYYNNGGQCANYGGQMQNFNDFYTGSYGNPSSMKFIPWSNSNAEYKDSTQLYCPQAYSGVVTSTPNYPVSSMSFSALDPYGSTYSNSVAIAWIKAEIDANRACAFVMGWPTYASWSNFCSYWNTNSGTYDPDVRKTAGYTSRSGHVMTIVGYDDVSRYWVVLNSWGTNTAHPSGTFRMDMDMDYIWELNGNRYANFWTGRHTINWAPAAAPTITSITPATGVNTGPVAITNLAGTGFASPATVKLTKSGQTAITATGVTVTSPNKITCTIPITGKAVGDWNVVVTTGGKTVTKANGFTISGASNAKDNIGVVRGKTWSVDYNGNGYWNSGDKTANFGVGDGKDKPVTGDWNGNGKTSIGVVRGNKWYVDFNGNGYWDSSDKSATFGVGDGQDKPVTGDWNGNGKTNIGVVRGNKWYVDFNGNGYWDSSDKTATFGVGDGQDKPVTGDWNGNGKTNIGVVRGNKWYVDFNGNGYWDSSDKSATFGVGDGKDIPVTGDWNGNGKTNLGVVRGNKWYVDYNGNGYWDAGDKSATFGVGDGKDIPVVGKWSGTGVASIESVEANQVQEPESPIQPPKVTRPESDIPRVEMLVKSSPVISPMSGGGVVPPQNPLDSAGGARATGRPAL